MKRPDNIKCPKCGEAEQRHIAGFICLDLKERRDYGKESDSSRLDRLEKRMDRLELSSQRSTGE